jgi:hypothetical protein
MGPQLVIIDRLLIWLLFPDFGSNLINELFRQLAKNTFWALIPFNKEIAISLDFILIIIYFYF